MLCASSSARKPVLLFEGKRAPASKSAMEILDQACRRLLHYLGLLGSALFGTFRTLRALLTLEKIVRI